MKAGESRQETTTPIDPLRWVKIGRRWWVNFQCRLTLLARITKTGDSRKGLNLSRKDEEWNSVCEIVLAPHSGLSQSQKDVIEADYKMENGCLVLKVRKALIPYLLQRLNLAMAGENPTSKQIEIVNQEDIQEALSFLRKSEA